MGEIEIKSRERKRISHWESLSDAKIRKEGAALAFIALEDMIQSIEIGAKHSARRYKLLKYIILSGKTDLNHLIDYGELPGFRFRFEDGKLIVNGEEASVEVVKK